MRHVDVHARHARPVTPGLYRSTSFGDGSRRSAGVCFVASVDDGLVLSPAMQGVGHSNTKDLLHRLAYSSRGVGMGRPRPRAAPPMRPIEAPRFQDSPPDRRKILHARPVRITAVHAAALLAPAGARTRAGRSSSRSAIAPRHEPGHSRAPLQIHEAMRSSSPAEKGWVPLGMRVPRHMSTPSNLLTR
jgi:hypothetical protein